LLVPGHRVFGSLLAHELVPGLGLLLGERLLLILAERGFSSLTIDDLAHGMHHRCCSLDLSVSYLGNRLTCLRLTTRGRHGKLKLPESLNSALLLNNLCDLSLPSLLWHGGADIHNCNAKGTAEGSCAAGRRSCGWGNEGGYALRESEG
jgi:hypothetical protein